MQEPDNLPERESKTQRKKQMLALQKIGGILVELPAAQLAKIPLESPLKEAVIEARSLNSHEGKRRQMQYIGKLMRHIDAQPILDALDKIQLKDNHSRSLFHQVERWRDKFIEEGDNVLQSFIQKFPATDNQHLRQLIRNAQKDTKTEKNTGADTALFRYLKEIIDSNL
jgi:ribosome-associated protein